MCRRLSPSASSAQPHRCQMVFLKSRENVKLEKWIRGAPWVSAIPMCLFIGNLGYPAHKHLYFCSAFHQKQNRPSRRNLNHWWLWYAKKNRGFPYKPCILWKAPYGFSTSMLVFLMVSGHVRISILLSCWTHQPCMVLIFNSRSTCKNHTSESGELWQPKVGMEYDSTNMKGMVEYFSYGRYGLIWLYPTNMGGFSSNKNNSECERFTV